MEAAEPKRPRKKKTVSAMNVSLPVLEGGEAPLLFAEPEKKKKAAARRRPRPRQKKSDLPPRPAVVAEPLEQAASGTFARQPVQVIAIGARHVIVAHEQPLSDEGDLMLRIAGLFPEMSRMPGRVVEKRSANESALEITRDAIFLKFALDALHNARVPVAVAKAVPAAAEETAEPETRPLAPTRALPATFADARLALLEVEGTTTRVAHSRPLPLEGEHPFVIKTDIGEFSSQARVISWERLQDGRDVYVSTIEIVRNPVAFTCAIDELVRAGLLDTKPLTSDIPVIEPDPHPLPPLLPVVRIRHTPVAQPRPFPWRWMIAGMLLFILAAVAYVKRPDEHLSRAQAMIHAYEDGLMPSELDYSLPVYTNALHELAAVRPSSISNGEAQQMTKRIRRLIAEHRGVRRGTPAAAD